MQLSGKKEVQERILMAIKTSLIVATSRDLFISPEEKEDQPSTIWTSKEDKQFFNQKSKAIGVMIMGSKTFATIGRALQGRLSVVMTRNPEKWQTEYEDENLIFTDKNPQQLLQFLEDKGFEEVAICGGRAIYNLFLELGLVDKIYLTVEPVDFGSGIKLLDNDGISNNFYLEKEIPLNEKGTLLREYSRI